MSRLVSCLSLFPLCLCLAWTQATADVRVTENGEDGILITNLPDGLPEADSLAIDNAPAASQTDALPFNDAVEAAARRHRLEPALLHAVIAAESGHNPRATSTRGAQGLMQLMPATARQLGVSDSYDPRRNIDAGALYLRQLHDMFQGDLTLTLAAYNAGPGAVLRYGKRIPPFRETRRYVPAVMKLYRELSARKRVATNRS
jgi:soluble lytic murein transglycosylase-like protein